MKKILCACSIGGHLTEMLRIIEALELPEKPLYITYNGNAENVLKEAYFIGNMGKIRNIPWGLIKILVILLKERPEVVISTGAENGMFAILLSKVFLRSKTIYIECSAQVNSPSISGRVCYYFSDLFFVQWKPLLNYYGERAKYGGNLIFGNL